eukprot:TRINITY_DN15429_c0_g1_i11.p1 TRINITY_DN15429_c0_g1~~TRINITY_DN15429_c0_g1_i11.p1  ORF type:complete len:119 (+),score=7.45 TRINITY_DN15429_c0_g1_i11:147-503(+)
MINKYLKEEYEKCKHKGIFMIAMYEIFWNQKKVTYFKQISKRLKPKLKLVQAQIEAELASVQLEEVPIPKYVRVNRCLVSLFYCVVLQVFRCNSLCYQEEFSGCVGWRYTCFIGISCQ